MTAGEKHHRADEEPLYIFGLTQQTNGALVTVKTKKGLAVVLFTEHGLIDPFHDRLLQRHPHLVLQVCQFDTMGELCQTLEPLCEQVPYVVWNPSPQSRTYQISEVEQLLGLLKDSDTHHLLSDTTILEW